MKENPQFQRTDKSIKQALITLLRTLPFEKITVQNILDETPVTRSTFYKHFHDKYEIAERMQEDYLSLQEDLRIEIRKSPYIFSPSTLSRIKQNQDLLNALLKVHSEKVDIRKTLALHSKEYYLSSAKGPNALAEAEIFSQTVTASQIAFCVDETPSLSNIQDIYISVFLKLLGLSENEDLHNLLKQKAMLSISQNINK